MVLFYVQGKCQQADSVAISYEIRSVQFIGNSALDKATLRDVVSSRQSPGWFSQFMFKVIGEKLGSPPEYYNSVNVEEDIQVLKICYEKHGYYHSTITSSVTFDSLSPYADIQFKIEEGKRSYVERMIYRGLDSLPPDAMEDFYVNRPLTEGMSYESDLARAEITRVLNLLSERGYPNIQFDKENSGAFHKASTDNFRLVFVFHPGKRYVFGPVHVHIDSSRPDIKPELVTRVLDFKQGEIFSRQKAISSERTLNRIDVFESVRIEPLLSDTTSSTSIPSEIYVRPRDKHEISPEIGVSEENNESDFSIGIGYAHRNFLGDARTFSTSLRLRGRALQFWNFGNLFSDEVLRDPSVRGAAELQFSIVQPYLFTKNLSGSWLFSVTLDKQADFLLFILRNKMGVSNRFATYTYGLFEWTLERVDPRFDTTVTHQYSKVLTLQENQKQFNSILTLTLQRDKTNDLFSPTEGFFNSATIEESGILPELLPGIQGGLPYVQYYKTVLFGRWYQDLTATKYNILAIKGRAGYQDKYGHSKTDDLITIPLNRRFYGGGSGSVRGWRARDLGTMPDSLLAFGGNFIFEATMEMRVHYFRGYSKVGFLDLNNVWGVYFIDFGNVWNNASDFRVTDIAIAMGIGIRYETVFGPFRIDFGFRVYDPKEVAGKQFIFQKRFLGDVLSNGVFHFGIGQAF